jgi:hypothetical protein
VLIGGRTAPTMLAGAETAGDEGLLRLRRVAVLPLDDGWLLDYRPSRP